MSMSSFPVLQSPSVLDLSYNALDIVPITFADDSSSHSLMSLDLSGNRLSIQFRSSDQSPNFARLGVRDLKLREIGVFRESHKPLALCALPNSCETLERLDLSNNLLDDLSPLEPDAIGAAVFGAHRDPGGRLEIDLRNNSLSHFPERLSG